MLSMGLHAQDDLTLPALEEEALLRLLFDAEEYSLERGGKWSPDFEEGLIFNVSDDGYCHTHLDTAMMVPLYAGEESEDLSLAVLVFTTYEYHGDDRADCHGCAPDISVALYEEAEDEWSLRAFRKHITQLGSWGVRGDLAVVQIGEGHYALDMSAGFSGQGYTTGWSQLISLSTYNDLDELAMIMTYDSGPAGCEEECDQEWCQFYRNVEREIGFVPNIYSDTEYPEFYNMVVTVTESTCKGSVRVHTERYAFNGFRYEQVCE